MAVTDDNIVVSDAVIAVDGVDCGHTSDPVTITNSKTFLDVKGQRRKGTIKKVLTDEVMTIATSFLEPTLTNLKRCWGLETGTGAVSGTSLNLGSDVVVEHTVTITGKGPNNKGRTVTLYRVVATDPGSLVFDKNTEQKVAANFEALKDASHLDAQSKPLFGTIVDEP